MGKCRGRYASDEGASDNPFGTAEELKPKAKEWQRWLLMPEKCQRVPLLCWPEDVGRGLSCRHREEDLCASCQMPVCWRCVRVLLIRQSNRVIPMVLCNDNLWGYTTDLIAKYRVRWIEAAIVSPC